MSSVILFFARRCGRGLSAKQQQFLSFDHGAAGNDLHRFKCGGIGHNDRRGHAVSGGCNCGAVELQKKLTLLYPVAHLHLRGKAQAFQLHGIHANMDQKFNSGFAAQADGMLRLRDLLHNAVKRCHDGIAGRLNGAAFTQCFAGKDRILGRGRTLPETGA